MLTPRRFVFLLAGLGFGAFAFACSSDPAATTVTAADAGPTEEEDGSAAVAEDGGKDMTGESCDSVKVPCAAGYRCLTISGTGGYCAKKCAKTAECGSGSSCVQGMCVETCRASSSTNTCSNKSRMVCQGDLCVPNCALDSTVCAAPDKCETFDDVRTGYCVPPLNLGDAGSDASTTCQTPTTTAASGVTTTKTVGALTDGEKGTLCDWSTGRYGGYGCKATCDGGISYTNKKDQAACKASFKSTCPATVAQAEECIRQDSVNRCAGKIFNDPVCAPMRQTGCL
jgi:hypothetical protein